MAIVNMTKFSLFTFSRDQQALLEKLQTFNYVHLLKPVLDDPQGEKEETVKIEKIPAEVIKLNEQVEKVNYAIKLLSNYDVRPGGLKGLQAGNPIIRFDELATKVNESNWEETYYKVKEISDRLDALTHQETKLRADLEEVSNWTNLDVSPRSLENLQVAKGILGSVPRKISLEFEANIRKLDFTTVTAVGGTKTDIWYLLLTHPKEEHKLTEFLKHSAFSQMRLDYDEVPLERKQRLNKEIIEIKAKQRETKEELKVYGGDLPKLEMAYEYLANQKNRLMADNLFVASEFTKATEGYIPTEQTAEFKKAIEDAVGDMYYLQTTDATRDDQDVPIMLKNNKFNSAFTNITKMYSLPSYDSVDPTPMLAPFYFLFFGMMIGDAGYGLLLFLGAGYALKKMNLKSGMKNMVRFFFYLSIPSIIWGIIYGSYFSLELGIPGLLNPSEDFMTILIISVILGGIQLFFGLAIKAYVMIRNGQPMDAVYDVLSWYMTLTGLILVLLAGPLGLPAIVGTIATVVMVIGMAMIVIFSARESLGWGGRIAGGVYNLYGLSSWVGDFVSYSRLMALGLSSGFIGMAFNLMANMIGKSWYLLPFAALIFLVGHGFNLFLSLLSAYVHALRLTYVEFFGKFYEGGGKPFNKLKKDPKYLTFSETETYE
ncbi:MAG: V-type ATP synthase subunit I [Clostridiaceae bacterium]